MPETQPQHPDPVPPEVAAAPEPSPAASVVPVPAPAPRALLSRLGDRLTPTVAGLVIALAAGAAGVATVSRYGLTCDSPSLFYAGDRTLFWMGHLGQPGALDLLAEGEPKGFTPEFQRFPDFKDPVHYPVLPGLIAAATSWLLHTRLMLVNHVDGHHLGLLLFHALGLFLFCLWGCRLLGRGAGITATVVLALFPSAVGHAANNAKDWPCGLYYGVAVLAAGVGILEERMRHLVAAGVLVGISLAAKMNAAFVLPTLLVWSAIAWFALHFRRKPVKSGVAAGFLLAPFIAFAVFFVTWPWLWYGSVPAWWDHLSEYVRFMVNYGAGKRPGFTLHPFKVLVFMTPPVVLAAAAAWLVVGWRGGRERFAVWALLLCWLGLPVMRIAMPHSNFYDANRHFIEYVPALSAMAGAGAAWAARRGWGFLSTGRPASLLGGRLAPATAICASLLALVLCALPSITYHPFQTTYFNFLVGGLGGAQRMALFAMPLPSDIRVNGTEGDYWFSSTREAMKDVRRFAPPGEPVGICGAGRMQALWNWVDGGNAPRFYEVQEPEFETARHVYVAPRETACWWRQVRRWESQRPILKRVERGGGLVYEILGPKDGKVHTPTSPESWYELHVHPDDKVGLVWKQEREEAERKKIGQPAPPPGR